MNRARIERIKAEVAADRRFKRGDPMRDEDIVAYLNAGLTKAEFLREFPDVGAEQVARALARSRDRGAALAEHIRKA